MTPPPAPSHDESIREHRRDVVDVVIDILLAMAPRLADEMRHVTGGIMSDDAVREALTHIAPEADRQIRQQVGGQDAGYVAKKKRPSPQQLEQAYREGLSSAPTHEVTRRHGISRATLYRLMKRGPGAPG